MGGVAVGGGWKRRAELVEEVVGGEVGGGAGRGGRHQFYI